MCFFFEGSIESLCRRGRSTLGTNHLQTNAMCDTSGLPVFCVAGQFFQRGQVSLKRLWSRAPNIQTDTALGVAGQANMGVAVLSASEY